MWQVNVRSSEYRDDGKFYIIVDFFNDIEKKAKEYLIDNPTKTLEWFKSVLKQEIATFDLDPDITGIKTGLLDLGE